MPSLKERKQILKTELKSPSEKWFCQKRLLGIGCGVLLFLSVVVLIAGCLRVKQASHSFPVPINFVGEYSHDKITWETLTETSKFNALDGDLYLRGHFDVDIPETILHVYLDHIAFSMYSDGEKEYDSGELVPADAGPDHGSSWVRWTTASISTTKEVTIYLSNPHSLGNPRAYNDFLDKLYCGWDDIFSYFAQHPASFFDPGLVTLSDFLVSGQFWRTIGFVVVMLSALVLGVALADSLQSKAFGVLLWEMGVLALLAGSMMVLDTVDVSLWHNRYAFNNYCAQLCRMLWTLTLTFCATGLFSGRRQWIACFTAAGNGAVNAAFLLAILLGKLNICRIITCWVAAQTVIFLLLFLLCIDELFQAPKRAQNRMLVSLLLLLAAVVSELGNARFGWWQRGLALNSIFTILFAVYLIQITRAVPQTYRAVKRAAEQEKELANSRISIMISQIQPHFLYNALNTIQALCKTQPVEASRAIGQFSKYVRGNMDSLTQKATIPLEQDLEHLNNYLSIEKLRFPDFDIRYDMQCINFSVPPLTLQPLVENAIRHGIGPLLSGGIVTVASWEDETSWYLRVSDNGVGFSGAADSAQDGRSHVGIKNIRSRLKSICHGVLTIDSAPGADTKVTIIIPKEVSK